MQNAVTESCDKLAEVSILSRMATSVDLAPSIQYIPDAEFIHQLIYLNSALLAKARSAAGSPLFPGPDAPRGLLLPTFRAGSDARERRQPFRCLVFFPRPCGSLREFPPAGKLVV